MTMTREQHVESTESAVRRLPDPAVGFAVEDGAAVVSGVNQPFREAFSDTNVAEGTTELGTVLSTLGIEDGERLASRLAEGTTVERVVAVETSEGSRGSFLLKTALGQSAGRLRLVALPEAGSSGGDGAESTDPGGGGGSPSDSETALDGEWVASTIAHDLRNPLDVAEAHLEVGRETGDAAHFESVADAHHRMESIITDVLTLVRGDEVEFRTVDLEATARAAWESVQTPRATLTVASSLPRVSGDRRQLERLFENLFRNAVEHAGEDSTVRIGWRDDDTGFYVVDDGPGVSPDHRDDLFETGVSTDSDGTGLGLAIVARIVEAH
ncbi:MAG: sensor histidine kinase, partial [Halobaculum sp.]